MILSPHSFWQASVVAGPSLLRSRRSLLHYSLRSFENNMSSRDGSQSARAPCCRRLFTSICLSFSSSCLPLPFSPVLHSLSPSFISLTKSLHIAAGVHTYTWNDISWWVSNERWMLDELRLLGVAAYISGSWEFCVRRCHIRVHNQSFSIRLYPKKPGKSVS